MSEPLLGLCRMRRWNRRSPAARWLPFPLPPGAGARSKRNGRAVELRGVQCPRSRVNEAVSFGERLASSHAFGDLFPRRHGACRGGPRPISTGPGRQESKRLEPATARLAYAQPRGMRLTTRLMQLASWLFASIARSRKARCRLRPGQQGEGQGPRLATPEQNDEHNIKLLPERLRVLIPALEDAADRRAPARRPPSIAPPCPASTAAIRSSAQPRAAQGPAFEQQ